MGRTKNTITTPFPVDPLIPLYQKTYPKEERGNYTTILTGIHIHHLRVPFVIATKPKLALLQH